MVCVLANRYLFLLYALTPRASAKSSEPTSLFLTYPQCGKCETRNELITLDTSVYIINNDYSGLDKLCNDGARNYLS